MRGRLWVRKEGNKVLEFESRKEGKEVLENKREKGLRTREKDEARTGNMKNKGEMRMKV